MNNGYLNYNNDILIKRYEELRSEVINSEIAQYAEIHISQNKGRALFLRQGMIGWIKAWSLCTEPRPALAEEPTKQVHNPVTDDIKSQVTIILANMALYSKKEVAALC